MKQESTMMEIEYLRKELDEAALRGLNSEDCFRISLKLDTVLEKYYEGQKPR